MKLSQLGNSTPKTLNFIDPYTEKETDIFVDVIPIKSKLGKEAEHKMRMSILNLMQDENNCVIDGEAKQLKPEFIEQETIKYVADLIVSWKGIEDDKGKQIKFSKDTAIEILTQSKELVNAVYGFALNEGNSQTA